MVSSIPLLIILCKLFDSLKSRIPVNVEHCLTLTLTRNPNPDQARSIGDHLVKTVGVTAEPVVVRYEVKEGDSHPNP